MHGCGGDVVQYGCGGDVVQYGCGGDVVHIRVVIDCNHCINVAVLEFRSKQQQHLSARRQLLSVCP